MYQTYQAQRDALAPWRSFATLAGVAYGSPAARTYGNFFTRNVGAGFEMLARGGLRHTRPAFGIDRVTVDGREVGVTEEAALVTPFATLLHFKADVAFERSRVLAVAPLSGHFATLLRGTVRTMLADHDVYVTDWHNARDVPVADGVFGADAYVRHVIRFLEAIGPGAHVVAVCQPAVAVLAAVAVMSEAGNDAIPPTMTLMAGPIDTRIAPTVPNDLAKSKPIEWFERTLIDRVPARYAGAGRRVYPGFLQLAAFMNMNFERHANAYVGLFRALVDGDDAKAEATRTFYDEYFSVLDLTAEFYLETVRTVFQEHALPLGKLTFDGRRVEPRAIERTSLLTIEGEKDDICGLGQTQAAHALCTSIDPSRKNHHVQDGAGHYGVFSGRRWETQIYPIVRETIRTAS